MNENNNEEEKKKLEEQIEELLNDIEGFPQESKRSYKYLFAKPTQILKSITSALFSFLTDLTSKISLNQLLIFSIILICFSLFFRKINIFFMQWLFVLSSVLFIISFAGLVLFTGNKSQKKYWRGRMISDQDASILNKLKKLFRLKKD